MSPDRPLRLDPQSSLFCFLRLVVSRSHAFEVVVPIVRVDGLVVRMCV